MATADQIKSLIKAHIDQNDEKFKTVVLQIAASEAKRGHEIVARELKNYATKITSRGNVIKINDGNNMFIMTTPQEKFSDLIVSEETEERIKRILQEYRNQNKLRQYGLSNRRKILIEGQPGTGKTYTASVIASELNIPLYTVQMDKVVTKFMGETSVRLRQIFDQVSVSVGVYLFDEFDAIGADRSLDNEVGEARRILNSFLQFIEQDNSNSLIIASTNNQKLLDQALFRRFDDVLHYDMPSNNEIRRLYKLKLDTYSTDFNPDNALLEKSKGLSHAEIIRVCDDAIKESILSGTHINKNQMLRLLDERKRAYSSKEAQD